ncbi:CDP-alcohol phosphatidyltransferase family protein [Candidatus Roizmanbacteria bacterium]|nr:CDP-alcohol phosphatidyltransferase family protein [Candidatus Roizmanbacteria bacterium]
MSEEANSRNKWIRGAQSMLGAFVLPSIVALNRASYFRKTAIERALNVGELLPDDLTLSQLEMTVGICKKLAEHGLYKGFNEEYILTNILDGADGLLARRLNKESPEGAMKDVLVDRLCEAVMAKYIATERYADTESRTNLQRNLSTSFQLSTLSKAACEACNVETGEGGIGSMIERRRILYGVLHDIATLKTVPESNKALRDKLLHRIDINNQTLISKSRKGAIDRIETLARAGHITSWNNNNLENDKSLASGAARKYAAVVLMNKKIVIDSVEVLNSLAGGKIMFPSADDLIGKYKYIPTSLGAIDGFYQEALRIANITS